MGGAQTASPTRKDLGAWYTPPPLVDLLCERTITAEWLRRRPSRLRVVDPACGDGRLLAAVAEHLGRHGRHADLVGCDIDPVALDAARRTLGDAADLRCVDALTIDWAIDGTIDGTIDGATGSGDAPFDLVIGNPPFRSQMATRTTRGGSSRHGGGPYADTAAEFLGLAATLAAPGGRIALVLPQSILGSRDAASIRCRIDTDFERLWQWWSPEHLFDAAVLVCALGFERRSPNVGRRSGLDRTVGAATTDDGDRRGNWAEIIADARGVPRPDGLDTAGTLGRLAVITTNFRDEYYGLVPAVSDTADGPPLITAGSIDPGRCLWGERPVRFAKQRFTAPRVDLERLSGPMQAWAARKLVPKVLVASQTRIIEAVADPGGRWLPGVPVTTVVPRAGANPSATIAEIAAVLTSPVASAVAWHRAGGTGLSAAALRLGPGPLGALPWPAGDLAGAVAALDEGDIDGCGRQVALAYGLDADDAVIDWWLGQLVPRRGHGRGSRNT